MNLRRLIEELKGLDPALTFQDGFNRPHSYRGYYEQLAFEPAKNVTVAEMLADAESSLGKTFEGYKGGDYAMHEWTDCWLSEYGTTGERMPRDFFTNQIEVSELRARIAALKEPFRHADSIDWEHLDLLLGQSGHGKFWRAVFKEFRPLLKIEDSQ